MSDALVLTAVEFEARRLARELELPRLSGFPFPAYEAERRGHRLRLAPVGLRAALLAERWSVLVGGLASPLVVSAGTCGGLAPELRAGDLVLPESVIAPGGERLNVTPGAHALAAALAPEARRGLLLTSRDVVATPEDKAERFRATAAAAVDLESAFILAWASRHGYTSLVVRGVADPAGQHLPPELVGLVSREGKLRPGRAVALALTRPGTIPPALLLRRGTARALRSVARLVAALAD